LYDHQISGQVGGIRIIADSYADRLQLDFQGAVGLMGCLAEIVAGGQMSLRLLLERENLMQIQPPSNADPTQ